MAHWGSSEVTGRGLLALVGNGQLYNLELKAGEQYIAHPRYDWLPSLVWVDSANGTIATWWLTQ